MRSQAGSDLARMALALLDHVEEGRDLRAVLGLRLLAPDEADERGHRVDVERLQDIVHTDELAVAVT